MRTAAGLGAIAAVLGYVVREHYLQIGWVIALPVPVVWWVLGWAAGVIGVPLMMAALGRRAERLIALTWPRLLLTWVVPCLVAYGIWVLVTLLVLDRLNPGFAFLTAHRYVELLPAPELSLLYALALLPVLAKLLARIPAPLVVLALCALTPVTSAAMFLVFGYIGLCLPRAVDRLSSRPATRDMLLRTAVAAVGAAVLAIPRVPHGLGSVVAGLAALPLGLSLASLLRSATQRPHPPPTSGPRAAIQPPHPQPRRALKTAFAEVIGDAAVPIYLLLVPVLAVADKALLARISVRGPSVQAVVALLEPAVLTAIITAGGMILYAVGGRLRRAARPGEVAA